MTYTTEEKAGIEVARHESRMSILHNIAEHEQIYADATRTERAKLIQAIVEIKEAAKNLLNDRIAEILEDMRGADQGDDGADQGDDDADQGDDDADQGDDDDE